jgi:asparagine synthase (glutamine-hydrolysing)
VSGICGAVGLHGPPDAHRVERMTSWLARRGPDGRGTWHGARAAFGHALLDTTDFTVRDEQPCTLDGAQWVVADARLDGRAELLHALAGAGEPARRDATDAQLLLHAWRAWGEDCPAKLVGDFAFAVWDEARQVLFCARDHLGVKPFFYAHSGGAFVFASALDCLRREGGVADALDELAIADFLLFEVSQEPGATVFAAIRRLPPAHSIAVSASGTRIRRYWEVPMAQLAPARPDGEWLEEFDALLQAAVADRIGPSRVSVLMSGGLDSPAMASVAQRRGARVHAFTSVYDRMFADDERHYSSLAARFMGIPIRHRAADDYALFENYAALAFHFPEPANAPFAAADLDLYADAAGHSRVSLTGWDGDTLLAESPRPYFAALAAQRRWRALLGAMARFALDNPASASRSVWLRVRRRAHVAAQAPAFPTWLNDDFVARLRLHERWEDAVQARGPRDALRPYAHRILLQMQKLASFFEAVDASRTGVALEMRHPMFDLRLLRFCLALPTVPWCIDKAILRRWLRGRLPEAVRRRPKTPLSGYPHLAAPARPGAYMPGPFTCCDAASAYLDRGKMVSLAAETDPAISWTNLRAPALDLWFRHVRTA